MHEIIEALNAALPNGRGNARTTAALLSNPGCERRALLDAARVDLARLADRLGSPTQFGQSPFAIGQGNRFEQRIKADDHALLAQAIDERLGIFHGLPSLTSVNLETVPTEPGQRLIEARAARTADVLVQIATGDPAAPHVVDHGVTTLDVGGATVYLEQDALAFREGEHLRICEVKGFPIIDGTASPAKVGAAARQTAVYVASIQDTLTARGFDPSIVSLEVVLICPRNFSLTPTAELVDVSREVRSLRRQLRRRDQVDTIAAAVAAATEAAGGELTSLVATVAATKPDTPKDRRAAQDLVDALPYRYAPECLSQCDLARHCRACCHEAESPAVLGGDTASLLGDIGTISEALALADGAEPDDDRAEVAGLLHGAALALADAKAAAKAVARKRLEAGT